MVAEHVAAKPARSLLRNQQKEGLGSNSLIKLKTFEQEREVAARLMSLKSTIDKKIKVAS